MAAYPRTCRLTRPSEFQRVFERGLHRRVQVQGLFARVRESSSTEPRLGFALSKRSLKHAVDRNRIKRLMREAYRLNWRNDLESIINKGDLSIIFIYIDDKIQSYLNIESSLKKGLQKLAIQTTKQLESPEKKS